MYLYVKYFVLIIWWLTIFNKCIFDVQMLVGHSLFSGEIFSIKAGRYFTGPGELIMSCSRGAVNTGREILSTLTRPTIIWLPAPRAGGIIV